MFIIGYFFDILKKTEDAMRALLIIFAILSIIGLALSLSSDLSDSREKHKKKGKVANLKTKVRTETKLKIKNWKKEDGNFIFLIKVYKNNPLVEFKKLECDAYDESQVKLYSFDKRVKVKNDRYIKLSIEEDVEDIKFLDCDFK